MNGSFNFSGKMMQYCVAVLLVACVAAIPKNNYGHHGPVHRPVHGPVHGHGHVYRNPYLGTAGGLQNSLLFNGLNGGRRLSGSGGHITKSLTHQGKSIHVNDGRNVATATAHHDGRVSANVVPSHLAGHGGHLFAGGPAGGLRPVGGIGPVGLGPVGSLGPIGHVSPPVYGHGNRRGVSLVFTFILFYCLKKGWVLGSFQMFLNFKRAFLFYSKFNITI